MSTGTPEGAPLPSGGPTSVAAAKVQLGIKADDTRDDDKLGSIVGAVNAMVRTWRCADEARGPVAWPTNVELGAAMLVARLFRRKNSPAGVEAFGSNGAVYVSRNDPDIGQLLGLGPHQPPTVG